MQVQPLPIDGWIKLMSNVQGRDKTYRTVQYVTRMLAAILNQYSGSRSSPSFKAVILKLTLISQTLGLARKLFRVGRPLDNLQIILKILSSPSHEPIITLSTVVKAAGFGSWLLLDMFQWFHATKILQIERRELLGWVNWAAPRCWAIGLLASLLGNLHKLQIDLLGINNENGTHKERLLQMQETQSATIISEKNDDNSKKQDYNGVVNNHMIQALIHKHGWSILQDGLDLMIPASMIGYPINPALVGAAGTITSIMGAISIYKQLNR